MAAALRAIDADLAVRVEAVSSLYVTPPWGVADQPDFLNAVARVSTTLSAPELLELCLATERALKRVRRERWGPRLIDIDLLLFANQSMHLPGMEIPHPRMTERAFVMVPLAEIAPEIVIKGQSAERWLASLDRSGIVKRPGGGEWWRSSGTPSGEAG